VRRAGAGGNEVSGAGERPQNLGRDGLTRLALDCEEGKRGLSAMLIFAECGRPSTTLRLGLIFCCTKPPF
jgi:hypothetical protein